MSPPSLHARALLCDLDHMLLRCRFVRRADLALPSTKMLFSHSALQGRMVFKFNALLNTGQHLSKRLHRFAPQHQFNSRDPSAVSHKRYKVSNHQRASKAWSTSPCGAVLGQGGAGHSLFQAAHSLGRERKDIRTLETSWVPVEKGPDCLFLLIQTDGAMGRWDETMATRSSSHQGYEQGHPKCGPISATHQQAL